MKINDTRVIPARLFGYKPSGSQVEVLLVEELAPNRWLSLVKPGRRLKPGATVEFPLRADDDDAKFASTPSITATIRETEESISGRIIDFHVPEGTDLWDFLPQLGKVPLPPYVTNDEIEGDRYQTVYGNRPGAIAAPTAGLHFTPELLRQLDQMGIPHCFITLHVGVGTFRPVEVEDITTHDMHSEWLEVPAQTAERLNTAREQGGRIIAVGTTVVRALESAGQMGTIQPYRGKTNLFIYPGYGWKAVDGLITNFHLPKSSLMMLVSALIGRPRLLALYEEAIAQNYRFYSFGDAMIILPEARFYTKSVVPNP
jgi:S-adenosylmethionine:tRNA ribosyltransferase-isomerase